MTSSDSVVQVLQGKNAVNNYRKLMGATNPSEADEGTLRAKFAESLSKNAVHGSDSLESAQKRNQYNVGNSRLIMKKMIGSQR